MQITKLKNEQMQHIVKKPGFLIEKLYLKLKNSTQYSGRKKRLFGMRIKKQHSKPESLVWVA